MAVNSTRNMNAELQQGVRDSSYIQLSPNVGGVYTPPTERLSWPTYLQVDKHADKLV